MPNIAVSDHYLAYFDVLGYKILMSKLGENEYLNTLSKAIDDTFAGLSNHNYLLSLAGMTLDNKIDGINIDVFSDNALLSLPSGRNMETSIVAFVRLLTFMADLQTRLACEHGIFIRGALIKGTFYRDSRFLGGQGLVKVYSLESSLAIYPRVLIDKECYEWIVQITLTLDQSDPVRIYMVYLINNFMFLADDGLISIHHLNVQNWSLLKK